MSKSPIIVPGDITRRTKRVRPHPLSSDSSARGAEWIPDFYKDHEVFDDFLRFMSLLAPHYDFIKELAHGLPHLNSVTRVPPQFLKELGRHINFIWDDNLSAEAQRVELCKAMDVYRIRGTPDSAVRCAKLFGADKAFVFTPFDKVFFFDTSKAVLSGGFRFEEMDFWRWGTYEVAARRADFTKLLPKIIREVHPAGTVVFGRLITDLTDVAPSDTATLDQWKIYVIEDDYQLLTVVQYPTFISQASPAGYWKLDEAADLEPAGAPLFYSGKEAPHNDAASGSTAITHPNNNLVLTGVTIPDAGKLTLTSDYDAFYSYTDGTNETNTNVTVGELTLSGTNNAILAEYPKLGAVTNSTTARVYAAQGSDTEKLIAEDFLTSDPITWVFGRYRNIGDRVSPTSENGWFHICISAGFSGTDEPSWATSAGTQTTDGNATWMAYANTNGALLILDESAIYGSYKYGAGASGIPAIDSSGNGLDGEYVGGVERGVEGALVAGSSTAARFDGTDGRVRLPASTTLKPLSADWTVEVWARPTSTSVVGTVVGNRWNNGDNKVVIHVDKEGGKARFQIRADTYAPANTSNLVAHYKTTTVDVEDTTNIPLWDDDHSDKDWSQGSDATRPYLEEHPTGNFYGPIKHPVAIFSTTDFMSLASQLSLGTDFSIHLVFKLPNLSGAPYDYYFFGSDDSSYLKYEFSTKCFVLRCGSSDATKVEATGPTLNRNTFYTLTIVRDGATYSLYINNTKLTITSAPSSHATAFTIDYLGKSEAVGESGGCRMELAEVLLFSPRVPSMSEVTTDYLVPKYTDGPNLIDFQSPNSVQDGSYHHFVGVIDRTSNQARFYVDGSVVASSALPDGMPSLDPGVSEFQVGTRTTDANFFDRDIDEVAIYQDALTSSQVALHYNSATGSIVTIEEPAIIPIYVLEEEAIFWGVNRFIIGKSKIGSEDTLGETNSTLESVVAWVDPVPPLQGKAMISSYPETWVDFPAGSKLNDTMNSDNWSIDFWYSNSGGSMSNNQYIWGNSKGGNQGCRSLRVEEITTFTGWMKLVEDHPTTPTEIVKAFIPDATQTHYAFTYDGTTARAYKDGVLVNTANHTFSTNFTGQYQLATEDVSESFRMSELRIYDEALSPSRVLDHSNRAFPYDSGIVAHYEFNDNVEDSGPFGIDGTPHNSIGYSSWSTDARPIHRFRPKEEVINNEIINTANGIANNFGGTLANVPVAPYSVLITAPGNTEARDDGSGNLTGAGIQNTSSVSYTNGVVNIDYTTAPTAGDITAFYWYDS